MKQVININFQGRVVPIEVTAYEMLKAYIESLSQHFANEEGKDEIINDIENRIGELFQERIKKGASCIVDDDVEAIIKSIGRPQDFDETEPSSSNNTNSTPNSEPSYATNNGKRRLFRDENHKLVGGVCSGVANYFDIDIAIVRIIFAILLFSFGIGFIPYIILWIAVPSSSTVVIGSLKKKLFRDIDDKYIAGVCSGIGNYLGISSWIPRVLFLLPLLSLFGRWNNFYGFDGFNEFMRAGISPSALIIYIILWLVLPEAKTTAEKLEMKGEKVDINSIKTSVVEELKGVQQRVQKFGADAVNVATDKTQSFAAGNSIRESKLGRSLSDVILIIVKGFAYFVISIVAIALIAALFFGGIAAIGIFPFKDYLLTDGWQNWLAWGTLIFFIITPMIGVITWIIRKLAKIKAGSKLLRWGFSAMWVIGWICAVSLAASIAKDFKRTSNPNEQEIYLSNPTIAALQVSNIEPGVKFRRNSWFNIEPFGISNDDTALLKNTTVQIAKSTNDSFRVTIEKFAKGSTRVYADTLANLINFNVQQIDSMLIIDKGISINKTDKFRNQNVVITIYVPVGKKIKVNEMQGVSNHVNFGNNWDDDVVYENVEHGWEEGQWYSMTKDGLATLDGKLVKDYNQNSIRINRNGINIRDGKKRVTVEKDGIIIEDYETDANEPLNKLDSLKLKQQKEQDKFRDSLEKEKDKLEKQLDKLDDKQDDAMLYNNQTMLVKEAMFMIN